METLRLLGPLTIEGRPEALSGPAGQRHRIALLSLLAAAQPEPVARTTLTGYLWPEKDEGRSRNLLSQGLHALRRTLGRECIRADRRIVRLDERTLPSDILLFDRAVHAGEFRRAVGLYRGPFLDGHTPPPSSEFERWVDATRHRLKRAYTSALEALADRSERKGDLSEAAEWWERLWSEDPLSTRVTLRSLDALARAGDRAAALRRAEQHAELLASEIDAVPDEALFNAVRRLRAGVPPSGTVSPAGAPSRPEIESGGPSPGVAFPLLGRTREWGRLLSAWRRGRSGPRMLVVSGVPGIGKTRLAEELLVRGHREGATCGRSRCYALEGRLAYAPVAAWLQSPGVRARLRHLDPEVQAETARILPDLEAGPAEVGPVGGVDGGWRRRRLFEAMARATLCPPHPLIWLIDDLQWCDPDTLEWLGFLLRFEPHADLTVVATARDDEIVPGHPWERMALQLRNSGHLEEFPLGPLDPSATAALAERILGERMTREARDRVFAETEGNPLLVVETVRTGADARAGFLPPRSRAVLSRRISLLSPDARAVAELAAIVGRPVDLELARRASSLTEPALTEALDELMRRRIFVSLEDRGIEFVFSHDKLREAVEGELGPARRARLHRTVAEALEDLWREAPDPVASRVATHLDAAGLPARAIPAYQSAARVACAAFAHDEALQLLDRALRLVPATADPSDGALEFRLQAARGVCAVAARGWAASATGDAFRRALDLGEVLGDRSPILLTAAWGRCGFLVTRTRFRASLDELAFVREIATTLDRRAASFCDYNTSTSLFHLGELDRVVSLIAGDPEFHDSPQHPFSFSDSLLPVFWFAYRSHAAWLTGHSEDAMRSMTQARVAADQRGDPLARGVALCYEALLHQLRGDPETVLEVASEAWQLCSQNGIPYYQAWAAILRGWARGVLQNPGEGLSDAERGLSQMLATGAGVRRPYYLGLLAELSLRAGDSVGAGKLLEEALQVARDTEELWCLPGLEELARSSLG